MPDPFEAAVRKALEAALYEWGTQKGQVTPFPTWLAPRVVAFAQAYRTNRDNYDPAWVDRTVAALRRGPEEG